MASDRALKLFIIAAVLGVAWYAGRETVPAMAIPVATVGLAAALWRAVLGIPVVIAMAAAAVYVPGVAFAAMVVVGFLAIISAFVRSALRNGTVLGRSVSPGDANFALGFGVGDIGGDGCGGGV